MVAATFSLAVATSLLAAATAAAFSSRIRPRNVSMSGCHFKGGPSQRT